MELKALIILTCVLLIWSFNGFIIKYHFLTELTQEQLFIINNCFYFMLAMALLLYKWDKNTLESYKNIKKETFLKVFIMVCLLGFSMIYYFKFLKENDITYISPLISGLRNIFILIIGYYIYKEKMTPGKVIGLFLISLGIYFLSK